MQKFNLIITKKNLVKDSPLLFKNVKIIDNQSPIKNIRDKIRNILRNILRMIVVRMIVVLIMIVLILMQF